MLSVLPKKLIVPVSDKIYAQEENGSHFLVNNLNMHNISCLIKPLGTKKI